MPGMEHWFDEQRRKNHRNWQALLPSSREALPRAERDRDDRWQANHPGSRPVRDLLLCGVAMLGVLLALILFLGLMFYLSGSWHYVRLVFH